MAKAARVCPRCGAKIKFFTQDEVPDGVTIADLGTRISERRVDVCTNDACAWNSELEAHRKHTIPRGAGSWLKEGLVLESFQPQPAAAATPTAAVPPPVVKPASEGAG
jgi:hypothetical protein